MPVALIVRLCLMVAASATTPAPRAEADTPEALAALVVREFPSGSATSFSAVYPFVEGRRLVEDAIERGAGRHAGVAHVVRRDDTRAVLVLSGYTTLGRSPGSRDRVRRRGAAPAHGVADLGMDSPVRAEHATLPAQGMGDDVARPQEVEDPGERRRLSADVHHHGHPGGVGRLAGSAHDLDVAATGNPGRASAP
jgi:hypothetical protein